MLTKMDIFGMTLVSAKKSTFFHQPKMRKSLKNRKSNYLNDKHISGSPHIQKRFFHRDNNQDYKRIERNVDTSYKTEPNYANLIRILATVGVIALIAHIFYSDKVKEHQDHAPLLDSDAETDHIKNASNFSEVVSNKIPGRAGAKKFLYIDANGHKEFFYVKESFSREKFVNELIYGNFLYVITEGTFPQVVLIQGDINKDGKARYFIGSKSNSYYGAEAINLGEWRDEYINDEEVRAIIDKPKGLGLALFIKVLLGDKDIKLDNLVNIQSDDSDCYGIDNEYCNPQKGKVIIDSYQLLASINKPNRLDNAHLEKDDIISFEADNGIQVDELLIEPFITAIEHDLNEGKIFKLMLKIANLTENDMENIISPYEDFLRIEEKSFYKYQIETIKTNVIEFLSKEYGLEQTENPATKISPVK